MGEEIHLVSYELNSCILGNKILERTLGPAPTAGFEANDVMSDYSTCLVSAFPGWGYLAVPNSCSPFAPGFGGDQAVRIFKMSR